MGAALPPAAAGRAFLESCLAELEALKPGNVHRYAPGHGMTVDLFEKSAAVAAPAIAAPGLSVGERILAATRASFEAAGCNTNLGIVLLSAPLVAAALRDGQGNLRARLRDVLSGLDRADAEAAFEAIRIAAPGGLGRAERHDVAAPARVTLAEAMAEAAGRDLVARQYGNGFAAVFDLGLPALAAARARRWPEDWCVTAVYLALLAELPDSHVARKYGLEAAERVRRRAAPFAARLLEADDPGRLEAAFLEFDAALKAEGLNPGTSADLTVASLLAARLGDALEQLVI